MWHIPKLWFRRSRIVAATVMSRLGGVSGLGTGYIIVWVWTLLLVVSVIQAVPTMSLHVVS